MYARFFLKQNGVSTQKEVLFDPDFSFSTSDLGDKLSFYSDDLRFLFLKQTDNKEEERRLVKVDTLELGDKLSRRIYGDLNKAGYRAVSGMSGSQMNESGRVAEIDKLMNQIEKEDGLSSYRSPNPYLGKDEDALKKQYFSLANHKLPEMLAIGFLNVMKNLKKKRIEGKVELCCVVDTECSSLVFALGDAVFHKYKCKNIFTQCVDMAEAISTLNVGQECSHWLTDALALAEKQGAFTDIDVEIFGSYMYGEYDMDVIYSSMG